MKGLLWIGVLVAVIKAAGLVPFESRDVANLVPVEALTVNWEENQVVLEGGECQGYGANWEEALADLQKSAAGILFLGTAEQVVISEKALQFLPDVVRCEELRPAAVLCVCPGDPPKSEDVAKYLSSHDAGMTIQKVQAAMLAEQGVRLPMVVQTEGGLRLRGSSNR